MQTFGENSVIINKICNYRGLVAIGLHVTGVFINTYETMVC